VNLQSLLAIVEWIEMTVTVYCSTSPYVSASDSGVD